MLADAGTGEARVHRIRGQFRSTPLIPLSYFMKGSNTLLLQECLSTLTPKVRIRSTFKRRAGAR